MEFINRAGLILFFIEKSKFEFMMKMKNTYE